MMLVTGTRMGLGHAVFRQLGGMAFCRGHEPWPKSADVIVHCAVNSARSVSAGELRGYLTDNVVLTSRLLAIPHRKFIYISSPDAHPADYAEPASLYAHTKLIGEFLVAEHGSAPLILRPSSMLGPVMRPNTTTRMLREHHPKLALTGNSVFNYVLHDDVVEFIRLGIEQNLCGMYDLASSGNVTLGAVAEALNLDPLFGSKRYHVPKMDNTKAAAIWPAFRRSSLNTVRIYAGQRQEAA